MNWWWLSFADQTRPKGNQFLGVVIIEAITLDQAITQSHLRGLNPGGEILSFQIPYDRIPDEQFRNRLLSREEATMLAS